MTVLITGASRGIGAALTARFLKEGHHTVIAVSRNKKRLDELKNRLIMEAPSVKLLVKVLDLTVESELKSFIAWFEESFSSLDILVNNAGYLENEDFGSMDYSQAEKIFNVNYFAPAMLIKGLAARLAGADKAHVVNIGSMGGFQGSVKFPGLSHYSASKAALAVLTECLAVEYNQTGIAFNCLAIGSVSTGMLNEAFPGYDAPVKPEDMADFIYDFAVNGHRFMNGKILPVALSTP